MNLPCMNCKCEVPNGEGSFFAEVFLCKGCHDMAAHFFLKLEKELTYLLVMAKEAIRVALVQGKFNFPEGPAGEPDKRAVLEEIVKLEDARASYAKEQACPPTPSTDNTPPRARTLARLSAEAHASSNKGSPPGSGSAT